MKKTSYLFLIILLALTFFNCADKGEWKKIYTYNGTERWHFINTNKNPGDLSVTFFSEDEAALILIRDQNYYKNGALGQLKCVISIYLAQKETLIMAIVKNDYSTEYRILDKIQLSEEALKILALLKSEHPSVKYIKDIKKLNDRSQEAN